MRKRKYRQAAACFLTAALILSAVPAPAVLAETETSSETIQQEIPEEESTVSVTSGTEVSEEESTVTVTPGTEVPEEESTITEMSGTEFPVETEPQTVPLTEQNTETETQVETKAEIQTESEIETETAIRMETSGETTEKETEVFIEQKAPRVENDVAIVKIGETETRCTTLVQAFAVANGNTATVTLLQNTTITDSINITGGRITFDGNNYKVTYEGGTGFTIQGNDTVIIAQNMNYQDDIMGINVYGATFILESGYILYINSIYNGGTVIINGGTIDYINNYGGTVKHKSPTPSIAVDSVNAGSVTVKHLDNVDYYGGAKYKLTDQTGTVIYDWQESNEFFDLSSNTAYKVYAKYVGNDSWVESEEAVTEIKSAPAAYHIKIPSSLLIDGEATSMQIGVDTEQPFDLGGDGRITVKINHNNTLASDGTLTLTREGADNTITSTLFVNNQVFTDNINPIATFTMANKDTEKAIISCTKPESTTGRILAGTYNGTISFEITYTDNGNSVSKNYTVPVRFTCYSVTVKGSCAQTTGVGSYAEGETVTINAGTREDYTFDCWTSEDDVKFANADSAQTTFIMPGEDVTVTANWLPKPTGIEEQKFVRYIVEHHKQAANGDYILVETEYPIGKVGETVTAAAKSYEGYTYNAAESNNSGKLIEIKGDTDIVTLKLYYDLTVFTVTVETSGNGDASASPASATMGQTVALTATPAEGSHFVKWEAVPGDITLNDNTFAMPASNVTVKAVFAEHTYSGWTQNDNDTHTRACTVCGVKQTEACTGGEATCTKEAVCEVCGQSYGEKDSDNHTGEPVWKQDADSHTQYYDCCGVVTVRQEPHEWENGKCAECGYGCTHSGGTATCTARAVCEVCGQPYGEKDPDNHTGQEAWVTTAESHTKVYSCCKAVILQTEAHTRNDEGRCSVCGYGCTHSGGTATCTQQAVCEICGALYGDPDPGNHTPSEVWTQENGKHYHVCLNGCETHLDEEACTGGTAACTAKAVCQVCGQPYGDLDPDNHINLTEVEAVAATQQAEGNTAYWYCEDCGRYFVDADASEEISQEDTVIDKLPADTSENGADGRPENGDSTTAGGTGTTGTAGGSGSQQSGSATSTSGGTSGKDSPKTGDDTAAGLWISFLALSGLGSVSLTILRRCRNR